ncbi:MAG TPA: efflux RND transporter permease subunit [Polyangia bacterium]|nr:efflux RND transporter permease subunit [Polyangia bacterium]
MIQRLVALALRLPVIVGACAALVIATGIWAYKLLDIEAYPNPVPPLVEVITQPDGWSPEEVERQVTIPLEIGLSGMPGLDHIRSQSLFGLSDVKCYFKWGTEYKDARQEVINRLQFVQLPPGAQAQLSPWNAIGEVFRYTVKGKGYTLKDLKTAEDWILERQFKQVPGVIDVTSYGGETKQYHVEVDPYRLRGQSVTLSQLIQAIANANVNVGGQRLAIGEQSFNVRGIGLIKSLRDIGEVVIAEARAKDGSGTGTPIRVRDVANVLIGYAPRLGIVGKFGCNDQFDEERGKKKEKDQLLMLHELTPCDPADQPDVVQGIILMRYGSETPKVLEGIYNRIDYIRKFHLLPPGMDIEPYYDRGKLVEITTHTVMENLLVGMGLVTIVLFLFLGNTRAAIITAINIPIALLIAFCGMVGTGTPANLISLGAVDFGIVIDSTVIMMENIFRHLGSHGRGSMKDRILAAAAEVGGPMTFSTLIIGVAFLPLFTMTGVSGVIFSPMAHTYAFAIGGAIILALTLTPALASKTMPADTEEKENWLMHGLSRVYQPLFEFALTRPKAAALLAAVPVAICAALFPLLGGEFMPKLEEGNFWIRATLPMSISLDQSAKYVGRMRAILRKHDEIVTVVSQLGRPDDGTDVSGFFNIELFAPLKPSSEWKHGVTKEALTDELSHELEQSFPGVIFGFSQMISDNVEEGLSGVKGENSVKVIGPDLRVNEAKADAIVDVMSNVKGVKDLGLFRSLGQPSIKITPDRAMCARYGLNTGDVEAVVQAAIGGQAVTQVYEGEKRFDLTVRWLPAYRMSVQAIRNITVATPDSNQIPLGQLASITEEDGPSVIYREDGRRYAPVKFSVRGRDLSSTIGESQRNIDSKVRLPYDTHLEWGGEINELKEAMGRLIIIIPITLLIIGFLVYGAVKNWIDLLIVLAGIPVACTGGVLALLVTRTNMSVSAAMGFISIFGIAIQDSLIVVTYFQRLRELEGHSIEEAARLAATRRLRPVLMTTLVAMLGLFPAAISRGIGAETQKPLAIVVIGGAFILALLPRLLQPALLKLAHQWRERRYPHSEAIQQPE